jgi:hypothetical protein
VRASAALKGLLYLQDVDAATTPEGTDGPRTRIHICRVCGRAAAGLKAQVHHEPSCALARLQLAQAALRSAWPELFTAEPAAASPASAASSPVPREAVLPAAAPSAHTHLNGDADPAKRPSGFSPSTWPQAAPPRNKEGKDTGREAGLKAGSRPTATGSALPSKCYDARTRPRSR